MKKDLIIVLCIGIILGSLGTYSFLSNKLVKESTDKQIPTTSHVSHNTSMTMQGMVEDLKGKKEDEFDKAFIELMIEHHQGAIDMAKEAKKDAKHSEIKSLSDDIIAAQTKEINEMKVWQTEWGYSK